MAYRLPPKRILTGKLFLYAAGGLLVAIGLALLVMVALTRNRTVQDSPFAVGTLVALCAIGPFGALWMIKTVIRQEPSPWPLLFLAVLLPYSFLWYYFERVRPANLTKPDGPLDRN